MNASVILALFLFGVGYNLLVAWLEARGYDRGYMAFIVSAGVGITLAGWYVLTRDLEGGLLLVACFAASGLPMILGSVTRYVQRRAIDAAAERTSVRKALFDG